MVVNDVRDRDRDLSDDKIWLEDSGVGRDEGERLAESDKEKDWMKAD